MVKVKGGDKFERALTDIAKRLRGGATLRVGFLEGATYPDGTPVAAVAAFQEFGAPSRNIPPRPFFRSMISSKSGEWPGAIAALLKANDYDAKKTLGQAGEAIAGQLRQSIVDTNTPPLAPATARRKGSEKPLVDTGHLLRSIDYEVK